MGVYSDKIESVGDFFGIELFVLKTGKERQAEAGKLYREKNKEKVRERRKIYGQANAEKIAEKNKKYYEDNKEAKKEYDILYRIKNKEKLSDAKKEYRKRNDEVIKEKKKIYGQGKGKKVIQEYQQSPTGKKSMMITSWKKKGLINDDYSKLYDDYLLCSKCDVCNKEFKTRQNKCMDHCHTTGLFRHFLCQSCNNHDYWKKVINDKETQ